MFKSMSFPAFAKWHAIRAHFRTHKWTVLISNWVVIEGSLFYYNGHIFTDLSDICSPCSFYIVTFPIQNHARNLYITKSTHLGFSSITNVMFSKTQKLMFLFKKWYYTSRDNTKLLRTSAIPVLPWIGDKANKPRAREWEHFRFRCWILFDPPSLEIVALVSS